MSSSTTQSISPVILHGILILHILSLHIINTNTKASASHWKLVQQDGKNVVIPVVSNTQAKKPNGETIAGTPGTGKDWSSFHRRNHTSSDTSNPRKYISDADDELVLQILTSTIVSSRGSWIKNGHYEFLRHKVKCNDELASESDEGSAFSTTVTFSASEIQSSSTENNEVLDCGRNANFTYYDQLIGIANRQNHPHIPEPAVALLFRKKNSKKESIDLNVLEKKLRKAKKEKPGSVQLYNQIGNFWRIKGNTVRAIECFRRALAVAPNNPEVLHNLARLLLYIGYLDDSLFLARRSLELQNDRGAWQQHFTLGEILKTYGHHQEALLHFKHTLELRPDHTGAQEALQELETLLSGTGLHICTLLIIIFLVIGVLLVMLSSIETDDSSDSNARQPHRHFSRALAMRSLKLGISPRALRAKRLPN